MAARRQRHRNPRTVAVNTLVLFEAFYLLNTLHPPLGLLTQRPARQPQSAAGDRAGGRIQLLFTYLPWMQQLFHTTSLDAATWGLCCWSPCSVFCGGGGEICDAVLQRGRLKGTHFFVVPYETNASPLTSKHPSQQMFPIKHIGIQRKHIHTIETTQIDPVMAGFSHRLMESVDAAVLQRSAWRFFLRTGKTPEPLRRLDLQRLRAMISLLIMAPLREQMEQLQRTPLVISSPVYENFTAPQWQLPS